MVLVRAHHTFNVVPTILAKLALAGPESTDFIEELRAIVYHELSVTCGFVVLPDVV
jgi:hypothetical protein